jgi:hypothetical protein
LKGQALLVELLVWAVEVEQGAYVYYWSYAFYLAVVWLYRLLQYLYVLVVRLPVAQ